MADLFDSYELAALLQVDGVNDATVDVLLPLVEGLIVSAAGEFDDPVPSVVRAVALQAAARAYSNPQGMRSETIGSYSYTRDSAASSSLYLTAEERALLRRAAGLGSVRSVPLVALSVDGALLALE